MTRVFVAVGSNINPEANLRAALRALDRFAPVVAVSTVYRTRAEGPSGQPDFYNCVVELRTRTPPRALKFGVLRPIEAELGRRRSADKYAPRTIDLDLILHGRSVLEAEDLVLPDPQIPRRPFLAIPLAELAPGLLRPGARRRVGERALRPVRPASYGMRPLRACTDRLRADVLHARGHVRGKTAS